MKARFGEIFQNKATVGILANRAKRNYDEKCKITNSAQRQIYNLALGHIFKQFSPKIIFDFAAPLQGEKYGKPQRFKKLAQYHEKKELPKEFSVGGNSILDHICNLNNHNAHVFTNSRVESEFADFLCEYFKLAVIIAALQAKIQRRTVNDTDLAIFFSANVVNQQKIICNFLKNCGFVINNELHIDSIIDNLLFIIVEQDFNYPLGEAVTIDITQGKYLSCLAQVFISSLFLYRGECNVILQKVNFFRIHDDDSDKNVIHKHKPKANFKIKNNESRQLLFNTLAKKMSSEDYDSKDSVNLVYFQDIMQYLHHFPHAWQHAPSLMQKELRDYLVHAEKERIQYAAQDAKRKAEEKNSKNNNANEAASEITLEKYIKDARSEAVLWRSNGRNRDLFMYFACRFLAESNYFGPDAQFKMYCYRSTDEQDSVLAKLNHIERKRELQKKYYQGRRTDFYTWAEHGEKFPDWLEAFVIQNNAVQIKIKGNSGQELYISLQRDLLIYFLEHALFKIEKAEKIVNAGRDLLQEYQKCVIADRQALLANKVEEQPQTFQFLNFLKKHTRIPVDFKKLLPKKLAGRNNKRGLFTKLSLKKIVLATNKAEQKYNEHKKTAEKKGVLEVFLKKNKGKQFKLYFITRAWKLMYFKQSYLLNKQNGDGKHHTHLNLDREEFNSISRLIHGMGDMDYYKNNLIEILAKKNLLTPELASILERANTIEDIYTSTRKNFRAWLRKQKKNSKASPTLESYPNLIAPDNNILYINLSHFLQYLQKVNILKRNNDKLDYVANIHKARLIPQFYYHDSIASNKDKEVRKIFNKLHRARLEDCYLYEIAHRYLCAATGQAKTDDIFVDVAQRYSQKLKLPIYKTRDSQGKNEILFNIELSWKKLAQYVELVNFQKEQDIDPKNKTKSFLNNIPQYLLGGFYNFAGDAKNIAIIANKFKDSNTLNYEELFMIYKNVMRQAHVLAKLFFAMEYYAISKSSSASQLVWTKSSYIDFDAYKKHIPERTLKFADIALVRKNAFHIAVPTQNYISFFAEIEAAYIAKLCQTGTINSWEEIPDEEARLLAKFLEVLHGDLVERKHRERMLEVAREQYVYKIIKSKNRTGGKYNY